MDGWLRWHGYPEGDIGDHHGERQWYKEGHYEEYTYYGYIYSEVLGQSGCYTTYYLLIHVAE